MTTDALLADLVPQRAFAAVAPAIAALAASSLPAWQRQQQVHQTLYRLIRAAPATFLLPAVLDFIARIRSQGIVASYHFSDFERWLDCCAGISQQENLQLRGKIVGCYIPRCAYQCFFPLGGQQSYRGPHFVIAHAAPDLDTLITSFWGWVDAFAARVGRGAHIWHVPPGGSMSQVEVDLLLRDIFTAPLFSALLEQRPAVTLTAAHLLSCRGVQICCLQEQIPPPDPHQAVLLVDGQALVSAWHVADQARLDALRASLSRCLRRLQRALQAALASSEVTAQWSRLLASPLTEWVAKEQGLQRLLEVAFALDASSCCGQLLQVLQRRQLFDGPDLATSAGHSGPELEALWSAGIARLQRHLQRGAIAAQIGKEVLAISSAAVATAATVAEMRRQIAAAPYLPVVATGNQPLGVVWATALAAAPLGSASLRDFSNRQQLPIDSQLAIVSVVDHHPLDLQTQCPAVALLADVQAASTLVAEQSMAMHERYSTMGMSTAAIDQQIAQLGRPTTARQQRILRRLLAQQLAQGPYFVDCQRQALQYLQLFFAILDDTDLLSKASPRDVLCTAALLDRFYSLQRRCPVELVDFDDLDEDSLVAVGGRRILQHPAAYQLYRQVYAAKEEHLQAAIGAAASGQEQGLFADTKLQNRCARVGQIKCFPRCLSSFARHRQALQRAWIAAAATYCHAHPAVDLHLQMISTIPDAEQIFAGRQQNYRDELWLWTAATATARAHLQHFLHAFRRIEALCGQQLEVVVGAAEEPLGDLLRACLQPAGYRFVAGEERPGALLRVPAGIITSRKGMITPHLPP